MGPHGDELLCIAAERLKGTKRETLHGGSGLISKSLAESASSSEDVGIYDYLDRLTITATISLHGSWINLEHRGLQLSLGLFVHVTWMLVIPRDKSLKRDPLKYLGELKTYSFLESV